MLHCQKSLFDLEENVTYLNGAYMSPQLKSLTQLGTQLMAQKGRPYQIAIEDFFQPKDQLQSNFARLINVTDKDRVAIIPSVSYGLANVANNVYLEKGQEILIVEEQFPSNYYCWKRLADQFGGKIRTVQAPASENRAAAWNEAILEAIDEQTKVVAMGHVHWADGTKFDLPAIRRRSREVGALLVIDGTQSVGALPFDMQEIQADALICAGYKWLMGPYSLGVAYYGANFDNGIPIEENWINRLHSEDFKNLVNYQDAYLPKAGRYSMGEQSNFALLPMLNRAIEQLLEWTPEQIQTYDAELWDHILPELTALGGQVEQKGQRGEHLVGIRLDDTFDREKLSALLKENQVYVSLRGSSIRVSCHLYNEKKDMERLLDCFRKAKHESSPIFLNKSL
jgi:selenocysteine lyase/cysteine desulfurase